MSVYPVNNRNYIYVIGNEYFLVYRVYASQIYSQDVKNIDPNLLTNSFKQLYFYLSSTLQTSLNYFGRRVNDTFTFLQEYVEFGTSECTAVSRLSFLVSRFWFVLCLLIMAHNIIVGQLLKVIYICIHTYIHIYIYYI